MVENISYIEDKKLERLAISFAFLFLLPVILFLYMGKMNVLIAYAGIISVGTVFLFPRAIFYLFLLSISVYFPTHITNAAIHPFDVCFILLAGAVVFDNLLRGKSNIIPTRLDIPFILFIAATVISAIFAIDINYSIVPCFRILFIYIAYRIFIVYISEIGVRKTLNFYIYQVLALSFINIVLFIIEGGTVRIFGPSWLAFETYTMTAIPMTFALYMWSEKKSEKIMYALISVIILFALLATQSRAPLLAVVLAVPVIFYFTLKKSTTSTKHILRKNIFKILLTLALVLVIGFFFRDTFFKGFFERIESFIESLANPGETVYLRIILWSTAFKAFLSAPITGIGIGNFKVVEYILPELRFIPEWSYIGTMSVHNVILQYLAETGILGTSCLLIITIINIKTALNSIRNSLSNRENQISLAIFMAIFIFSVTIFYMRAWTWGQDGYIMALLFALNMSWSRKLNLKSA